MHPHDRPTLIDTMNDSAETVNELAFENAGNDADKTLNATDF